jgi:ribosomal protein S18 acetylase RimI-like enzyme
MDATDDGAAYTPVMSSIEVHVTEVRRKRELSRFIAFPRSLYADDPVWTPSLRLFDTLDYRFGRNIVLARSQHALFLATREGRTVGRAIAYIDPRAVEHLGAPIGLFGAFESIDDETVSIPLFSAVEEWHRRRGTTILRGPIDPVAECWGFLVEGHDHSHIFMSPYTPPYYDRLAVASGFHGAKDLLAYEADGGAGYTIPERFLLFAERLAERRPTISVRRIDPSRLAEEARIILDLLNTGVSGNWGYVPVGEDEMRDIVVKLKLICDPDALWFVEDSGRPVGCAIGFPDINVVIRKIGGRLFPTGLFRLLASRRSITDFRLWGLAILPEYHGLGLDVLLYLSLYRALEPRKARLEANYVLEDNFHIVNALEKLGMKRIKRYRVYEKDLALPVP